MRSIPNPFLEDIYVRGLAESGLGEAFDQLTVNSIHRRALRRLGGHVADLGRGGSIVILLSSERAGSGKSHLLSRLAEARADDCFFIPVDVNLDSRPTWVGILQEVLSASARVSKTGSPITFLEVVGRRLMANATVDLILRGDVPAADPARAISMLKRDYLHAFDPQGGGSEVSRWMVGNMSVLLPLMGEVLGSRAMVEVDEAVAWLRVLSRFNSGNAEERKAAVASVAMLDGESATQSGAKQRLRSFCRLAGLAQPMMLVFDHVDALAVGKKDAMQLACMLAEMVRLQFGVGALLSVNGDVWRASLDGNLPGALEDRLSGREVRLAGIGMEEAEALVRSRLVEAEVATAEVESFLREAKLADVMRRRWGGASSPRDVLRFAAAVWDRLAASPSPAKILKPVVGSAGGESVRDYMSGEMPRAESLADLSTLRPMKSLEIGEMPAPASGPASAEPGKVDPGMIKQMGNISSLLRELKSRSEQFVPTGDDHRVPRHSSAAAQIDVSDEADHSSPLVQRFGQIRDSLLLQRGQRLDLDALRRMVSLAGERFPVIESSEFKMSPGDEPTVMKWVFPGNEILFGFEPEQQFRFWQSLIKLAGRRVGSTAAGRLKLVVFSENDHPFSGSASVDAGELEVAHESYLDVIDLDASTIASVTAADRVVCEMAKADEPVLPADTIRELAPQLDPLWRRITRPLVGSGEGEIV